MTVSDDNIAQLVEKLVSEDPIERQSARYSLIELGPAAVPAVAPLADSKDALARLECARTFAGIADPSTVDILVRLLLDPDPGVRWDAATALVNIGKPAVTPVLRAVIEHGKDYTILAGAHHVLHDLSRYEWGTFLKPVVKAIESTDPAVQAPVEAAKALKQWEYKTLDTAKS